MGTLAAAPAGAAPAGARCAMVMISFYGDPEAGKSGLQRNFDKSR
jgi:hypothetical protein